MNISVFIKELDLYFSRDDIAGAGEFLLKGRKEAAAEGDGKSELSVLDEMVGYYRRTGDEKNGMAAIEDCIGLIDELNVSDNKTVGTILLNCATTMKSLGKSLEAMKYYDEAERLMCSELDKNDVLLAGLYNNKALAYQDLKIFDKAEEYFQYALDITGADKDSGLEKAITLVNLSHLYAQNDIADIRCSGLMEQAAEILDDSYYSGFPKYAYVCRCCAPSFGYFGFFMKEKELNERADGIYAGA